MKLERNKKHKSMPDTLTLLIYSNLLCTWINMIIKFSKNNKFYRKKDFTLMDEVIRYQENKFLNKLH